MFTQDAKSGMDHIRNLQAQAAARAAAREAKGSGGKTDFISSYKKFEKGESTVRFVGNFFTSGGHFIGNGGKMNFLRLFDDSAFDRKAPKHLPQKIVCANWDFEKNERKWDGPCIICQLNSIAYQIAKSPEFKGQSPEDQAIWNSLKAKTRCSIEHSWNLIDRLQPEIKAYLMASMSNQLFQSLLTSVHDKWAPRYFASVDDGVDVSITVSEIDGKKSSTAALSIKGISVALTPLTEEEKSWPMHNLADKFGPGNVPDQNLVRELLLPRWRDILPEVEAAQAPAESASSIAPKKGNRPF